MEEQIGLLIAKQLKYLRVFETNKKIEEVSKGTGINKDTIYRYEKDASTIKLYILDILLSYYETNILLFIAQINANMQRK